MRLPHRVRRHVVGLCLTAATAGFVVVGPNVVVMASAHGRVTRDPASLPHAQAAIVPGALVDSEGRMSAILRDRVDGAIALYRAGTVDKILVSGDHGHLGYDETDTMRDAVLAAGVPARDVFTDHAGFSTWYTMARAAEVFDVDSAVVVTQSPFAARAVDLGLAAGIDVHALGVGGDYGSKGTQASAREVLARVKGFAQAALRPDVLGGPSLPITGDGRTSWGPLDPLAPTPVVAPATIPRPGR